MMILAPQLSLQDCRLLEYVLTRFLDIEQNAERKAHIRKLHAAFRDSVLTAESMKWNTEKLQEESPEL